MQNTEIIISQTSEKAVNSTIARIRNEQIKWAYLGRDVKKLISLEKLLHGKGEKIETGSLLQETAKCIRREYIDYVGKLNIKNNSLEWWANSFSERNPWLSTTFLEICYTRIAMEMIKERKECVILFVESDSVIKTILKNAKEKIVYKNDSIGAVITTAKNFSDFLYNRIIFLVGSTRKIFISKYLTGSKFRGNTKKSYTLLFTYVTNRSFDKNGNFHDSYLGNLREKLIEMGEDVLVVPYIWGASYYNIMKNVNKTENFLVPYNYLSVIDVLNIFFKTLKNKPKKERFPDFLGLDISDIIYVDLIHDWVRRRASVDLLFYSFIKIMRRNNIDVSTVIYPYENHTWEKVVCLALRKYYPGVYTIGYQHTTISQMHLLYFFSKDELKILPFPDKIITIGEYSKELFKRSEYPIDKLVVGGALRYTYLRNLEKKQESAKREKLTILVTTHVDELNSAELIWKTFNAFKDKKEYNVLIKCHPYAPFEVISKYLDMKLPDNFSITTKSVQELLSETDLLIYSSGNTCIEAIASNVPVIHVKSDLFIDMDQLDFNPKLRVSVQNPEELRNNVDKALKADKTKYAEAVNFLLGPVDESTYKLFVK